jgi:hypothetical protein
MEVLTRELDALDAAMIAIERIGKRGRASHPQRVCRVFEPLAVQGFHEACFCQAAPGCLSSP